MLLERLGKSKSEVDGVPLWDAQSERVKAVILKLARGHLAYEFNEPRLAPPIYIDFKPLPGMSDAEREAFEGSGATQLGAWPKVGSRAPQRMLVVDSEVYTGGWVVVQEGNCRFRASHEDSLTVRLMLREYLACEVAWV